MSPKLYNYWRSTSSYRTRIALNLKGIDWDYVPVDINAGEQHSKSYREISPNGFVPVLIDGGKVIRQTILIVEYLDKTYKNNPLIPIDDFGRTRVIEFLLSLTGDIQGRTQKRVRDYIEENFSRKILQEWFKFWSVEGLSIMEALVKKNRPKGKFFHGDKPCAADAFIIAQLFNYSQRGVDLDVAPNLRAIEEECFKLDTFKSAHPKYQIDFKLDKRF